MGVSLHYWNMAMIGGASFLLLLVLPRPAECLPISKDFDSGREVLSWRKQCVDPEECCIFARYQYKFEECCEEHGCCPLSCPGTQEGTSDIVVSESCDRGWECCRFGAQTLEYRRCCSAHGCCPQCGLVSKGCCYNGLLYEWGRTVEEFPELCLRLVCAVQTKPHFSSVIIPTRQPAHLCNVSWCDDCLQYSCVDNTGLLRGEGERWSVEVCQECYCSRGSVICHRLDANCPAKPHAYCVEVPGLCCPQWNCADLRINEAESDASDDSDEDETGILPRYRFRLTLPGFIRRLFGYKLKKPHSHPRSCFLRGQEGKEWPTDDPCVVNVCTQEGIQEKTMHCNTTIPFHPNCRESTPEGECCPQWNCSGCFVGNDTFFSVGSEWGSNDSCNISTCTEDGIQEMPIECEETPTPGPNCFAHIPEGECCEQWNCSGCLDDEDEFHSLGDLWSSSPCSTSVCTSGGVYELDQCKVEPKPNENCVEVIPEGECCPEWHCGGCLEDGEYYPLLHEWETDPCTKHICTSKGIQTEREECWLGSQPSLGCKIIYSEDECCPRWICSGCYEDGKNYELGRNFTKDDPCVIFTCTEDGISRSETSCDWEPPPNYNCFADKSEDACCKFWNCSGCLNESRAFFPLGHLWEEDDCTTNLCTNYGIVNVTEEECELRPQPHPSCKKVLPTEGCCEEWKCIGCLDSENNFYELRTETKTDNPCIKLWCSEEGVLQEQEESCYRTEQPFPNCFEYSPEGECCKRWNCSGCIEDGLYYPMFHILTDDPCTKSVCTFNGIEKSSESCDLELQPNHFCEIVKLPEKCCPEWNCSVCIDEVEIYRALNEVWKSDLCTTHTCVNGKITTDHEICEDIPLDCDQYTPAGECCPKKDCPPFQHLYE